MSRKKRITLWVAAAAIAGTAVIAPLIYSGGPDDTTVGLYVAAKSSDVFHRSGCRYVKRIKARNELGFASSGLAAESGRRPCKVCKP